jgi:hypothetical protein
LSQPNISLAMVSEPCGNDEPTRIVQEPPLPELMLLPEGQIPSWMLRGILICLSPSWERARLPPET